MNSFCSNPKVINHLHGVTLWLSMQAADNRGVLLNYDRNALKCDTTGILQELIGNRKHGNSSSDGTNTFLFATFYDTEPYLVIGSSQARTETSINDELTPFKSNLRVNEDISRLREKGSGAKLPLFHFRGNFSALYQTIDKESFSGDEGDWMMTRETDIQDLSFRLNCDKPFDIGPFVPYHKSAKALTPFWRLPTIISSHLMEWIRQSKIQSFYVYRNYSVKPDLDEHIERLACIYEGTDVLIFRSKDGNRPLPVTVTSTVSLGLVPTYWEKELTLYCKLGTTDQSFRDSQFKIILPSQPMYLKLMPNGKRESPTLNLTEDKTASWETADADISITIAKLSKEYLAKEPERQRVKYLQNNSMLSRMAFLSIEGDVVSDKPVADDEIGVSIRTSLLSLDGRFRILVKLCNGRVKDNLHSGLVIEPFKRDTKLRAKFGIHECIKKVCTIFKRCYDTPFDEKSIREAADSIALHRKASKQRSTEGKQYEQIVSDQLASQFDTVFWSVGDVQIQTRHGLIGQGIDSLGTWGGTSESPAYAVAVQVKDVKTLTHPEVEKFVLTVKELQRRNQNMLIFPFLVWKEPKTSIPVKIYKTLDDIDGRLVFDSNVYERIWREIGGYCED